MIGTIYRITTRSGEVVEGRVQGGGGMLGGAGPVETPTQALLGLLRLQRAAACNLNRGGVSPAVTWRVYPNFTAESNGPFQDVDIQGAQVEIVNIDTDLPTLGWPHERVKAAWRNFPKKRVRVNTLKRGDIFFSSEGDAWRYVRPDGALSGYHHVETLNGEERTGFAGNAEVLRAR